MNLIPLNPTYSKQNNGTNSIKFKGLNRVLCKKAYGDSISIQGENLKYPKSMGIVGNLCSEWIKKIPKSNKGEIIKEFYNNFGTAVHSLNNHDVPTAEILLKKAFVKAGILEDTNELTLKPLLSAKNGKGLQPGGAWGNGYQIKGVFEGKYMIKVFNNDTPEAVLDGNYIEPNRIAYWQKFAGKNTQVSQSYFSDINNLYMVNKFLSPETPLSKKYVNPFLLGLKLTDVGPREEINGFNKIRGYQHDYGGMIIAKPFLNGNKEYQFVFKKLFSSIEKEKIEVAKIENEIEQINSFFNHKKLKQKRLELDKIKTEFSEERNNLFENKIKTGPLEAKTTFASVMKMFPESERKRYFQHFLLLEDLELKKILLDNLDCFPEKDRAEVFKRLAQNADSLIKPELERSITCFLPDKDQAKCKKFVS